MGRVSGALLTAQQRAASGILEYVGGIQTLKAVNQAGRRFKTLRHSFDSQRKHLVGMEMAAAPVGTIGRFVLSFGISVVMAAGAWLLTRGALPPFYCMVFLLLSLNIYEPVMILFGFIANYARTNRSVRRIDKLKNERLLPEPAASAVPTGMDIEFQHVSFPTESRRFCVTYLCAFRQRA